MSHEEAIINEDAARGLNLSQPHFDQEATLVSAQPVVPLAEVRQYESRKRGWLVFSAIVLAVLVGATGGVLIYSRGTALPVQRVEQVVVEAPAESAEVGLPKGTASPEAAISGPETPATEVKPEEIAAVAKEQPTENVESDRDLPRANSRDSTARAQVGSESADQRFQDWQETRRRRVQDRREQVMDERREQRRESRREARRQRRGQWQSGDGSAEDLFRIREIFEGPRP